MIVLTCSSHSSSTHPFLFRKHVVYQTAYTPLAQTPLFAIICSFRHISQGMNHILTASKFKMRFNWALYSAIPNCADIYHTNILQN